MQLNIDRLKLLGDDELKSLDDRIKLMKESGKTEAFEKSINKIKEEINNKEQQICDQQKQFYDFETILADLTIKLLI